MYEMIPKVMPFGTLTRKGTASKQPLNETRGFKENVTRGSRSTNPRRRVHSDTENLPPPTQLPGVLPAIQERGRGLDQHPRRLLRLPALQMPMLLVGVRREQRG